MFILLPSLHLGCIVGNEIRRAYVVQQTNLQYMRLHPDDSDFLIKWGLNLYGDTRFSEAREVFARAVQTCERQGKSPAFAHYSMGLCFEEEKEYTEARKMLERAITEEKASQHLPGSKTVLDRMEKALQRVTAKSNGNGSR